MCTTSLTDCTATLGRHPISRIVWWIWINTPLHGILQLGKCLWYSSTAARALPSQNPHTKCMSQYSTWENTKGILTFICLRETTLSYDAYRTVRSWRQNLFDWFSRWPWNTLCNCVLQEGVGGSFQQYFYNQYKMMVYTGLRSDCLKIHASQYRHRWR
jgi:hypothetical protein